jgi:glycosyltransferase involved in cell wall biosynthesis
MNDVPKISIYITNRNYGKYIDRAIKSVLNQTFKDWELIIIDDASTDNSLKKIRVYENKRVCR